MCFDNIGNIHNVSLSLMIKCRLTLNNAHVEFMGLAGSLEDL